MGGFYGSIQFRSDDRDAVLRLAETIAKERACKFLCGPPLRGWIGLYPNSNGQDEGIASALAETWPGELLYLLVHDDDVFVYRYFRAGARIDAYWSAPGYFGDENRATQERETGNPDAYAHLVVGRVDRVQALLDRSKGRRTLELERLLEFAKLLGVVNAGTAYEYLENWRARRDSRMAPVRPHPRPCGRAGRRPACEGGARCRAQTAHGSWLAARGDRTA